MFTVYVSINGRRRIESTHRSESDARKRSLELEHAGILACYERSPGC